MRRPTLTFAWTEEMSVGIPEVDKDHQHFISLINDLNRAITEHLSPNIVVQKLQLIIDDAENHFAHEEKLFEQWHYPDTEEHSTIHAKVMQTLKSLSKGFAPYGSDTGWMDAGVQIKKILVDHILKEDMKYAEYYRQTLGSISVDKS